MKKLFFTGILVGLASAQIMAFQQNDQMLFTTDSIVKISKCNDSQCPNYRIKLYFPRFSKIRYRRTSRKLNQEIGQAIKNLEKKFLTEVHEAYQDSPGTYAAYLSELSGGFEVYYNQNGLLSFTMEIDYTLPLGTGYPERNSFFFNYDIQQNKGLTFEQMFAEIRPQKHWKAYLKEKTKGTMNSSNVKGFAFEKESVLIFFYGLPSLSRDEGTHEYIPYQDFWKYFKPKAPYQFLQGKVQSPNNRPIHQVAAKETLFSICQRYQINQSDFRLWNGLGKSAQVNAGQSYYVAPPVVRAKYRAEAGDSVYKICRKFAIHASEFRRWNKLKKGAKIYKGRSYWVSAPREK